jgi:hypothetical protein
VRGQRVVEGEDTKRHARIVKRSHHRELSFFR